MIIVKENDYGDKLDFLLDEDNFSNHTKDLLSALFIELKPRMNQYDLNWLRTQLNRCKMVFKKKNFFFLDMNRKNTRFLRLYKTTDDGVDLAKENVIRVICYNIERIDIEKCKSVNTEKMLEVFDGLSSEYKQFYDIDNEVDDLYKRSMEGYSEWLSQI